MAGASAYVIHSSLSGKPSYPVDEMRRRLKKFEKSGRSAQRQSPDFPLRFCVVVVTKSARLIFHSPVPITSLLAEYTRAIPTKA
jgi:hypothetical protein